MSARIDTKSIGVLALSRWPNANYAAIMSVRYCELSISGCSPRQHDVSDKWAPKTGPVGAPLEVRTGSIPPLYILLRPV